MGRYEATDPQAVRMETSIRARLTRLPGSPEEKINAYSEVAAFWVVLRTSSAAFSDVAQLSNSLLDIFEQVSEARSLSPLN